MSRKWKNISELCEKLAVDWSLDNCHSGLKCLGHAPSIGQRAWIFKYKGTYVSLWDMGNGFYKFHSAVTRWDVFVNLFSRIKHTLLCKEKI